MESEHAPAHSSILRVGLPLQLVIESGQDKVNCGSTLLGWKERAWLICEWPGRSLLFVLIRATRGMHRRDRRFQAETPDWIRRLIET